MKSKEQIPERILNDLKKSGLRPEDFAIEPLRSEEELIDRLGFTQIREWLKQFHDENKMER